jgi:ABC-type sugar transport system substrate-binding protein
MRRNVHLYKLCATGLVAVAASIGVAACGSSSSDSGTGTSSSGGVTKGAGIRAGTGSRAEVAMKAGEQAAKQAGAPETLKPKTLGIINFLGGIESSDRLKSTAQLAAKQLGWKTIVCDGKGTPTVFITCGNSLLDQGVDAIIDIAIEPSTIQPVLDKAMKQNVPVIQTGGGAVPNGDLSGNYGPDETKAGQVLSDYMMQKLTALPGNPGTIIHDYPAKWASARTDAYRKALKAQTKVKLLANTATDAANLVQFTRKTVADQVTQYPDAKAYWFSFDTTGQVGGQVISSKYPGKQFPDRPLVGTFHADLGTLDLMRKGDIDVTSEANYDAASWIAMDQLAEFWSRGSEISKVNQPIYPVVGDLFTYQIVTKDNLPPSGQYVPPKVDVPTYFQSKWKTEFGAS